jgi:hypothetical protein
VPPAISRFRYQLAVISSTRISLPKQRAAPDSADGRHASHFLSHSPQTVAGKHYVAPFQKNFDEALDWLRGQVFP